MSSYIAVVFVYEHKNTGEIRARWPDDAVVLDADDSWLHIGSIDPRSYINHLLTDLPSVDREEDGGKLLAHKAFWKYPEDIRRSATITELVYVPDVVTDGLYLLNVQITSLEVDASPSKPVIYQLTKL